MVGMQDRLIVSQDGLNAPPRIESHGATARPFPEPVCGRAWRLRLLQDEALGGLRGVPLMRTRCMRRENDATSVTLNDLDFGA
jgi:hypothetical protein